MMSKAQEQHLKRATSLLFATDTTRNIQLDTDDIPYLDTLKLKQ
jgi:hypothetical protein